MISHFSLFSFWVVISPQRGAAVVLEVPPGGDGFFSSFGGGVAPRERVVLGWRKSDWRKSPQNTEHQIFDFRFEIDAKNGGISYF